MGNKLLRVACLIALASAFPGAGRRGSFKEEMRFGAEAAQQGLWREAMFRWEKILKDHPDNARLHNNLGVAYESLGQFERARKEYEDARRLDPDNKEIRDNFESFQELCKTVKSCGGEPEAAPSPRPSPVPETSPAPGPASGPDGSATPEPSPSPSSRPPSRGDRRTCSS